MEQLQELSKAQAKEMKPEDLVIRLKIQENKKNAERSLVRVQKSLKLILLKKLLPNKKRERSPTGRSQNQEEIQNQLLQLWQDWS